MAPQMAFLGIGLMGQVRPWCPTRTDSLAVTLSNRREGHDEEYSGQSEPRKAFDSME